MTPVRKRRLMMVGFLVVGVALATTIALQALNDNLNVFYTATQVHAGEAPKDRNIRLGGMVVEGSLKRSSSGNELTVKFDVTDTQETVTVAYSGILPDLFKEGRGIITTGRINEQGMFVAEEVLAKHDENYMSPEVADSIEKAKKAKLEKQLNQTKQAKEAANGT